MPLLSLLLRRPVRELLLLPPLRLLPLLALFLRRPVHESLLLLLLRLPTRAALVVALRLLLRLPLCSPTKGSREAAKQYRHSCVELGNWIG